jgi:tetratricopeptide (TPR) repeat protein
MMALLLNKLKETNTMKQLVTLIFIFTLSLAFGQKKEIKKAVKAFEAGDVQGATDILETNAALFDAADEKVTLQKTYLEAKIDQANKKYQSSYDKYQAYATAGGKDPDYHNELLKLTSDIVTSAIEDNAEQRYILGASRLYLAYTINTETNIDYLYFAASSAVNGEDFESALKYYNKLKEMKYDGVVTKYFAKPPKSEEEVELSEAEYNLYTKTKEYTDFREETSESRYPEIIKNIALIYAQLGDNEKAMEAVKLARKEDPKDLNLILTEANLYIQLKESDRFEDLMKEAITQDPNNATLYFNLGVVNAQNGNSEEAKSYYKKTIELDPNLESGYLNLVSLILEGDSSIVEEMNGLGTSRADNARYDELKETRENLYKECVPILEKLVEINKNQEAISTLMNIYGTLGNNDGFKRMKELVE